VSAQAIHIERYAHDNVTALATQMILAEGLHFGCHGDWATEATVDSVRLPEGATVEAASRSSGVAADLLLRISGGLVQIGFGNGKVECQANSADQEASAALLETCRQMIPVSERVADGTISVVFWSLGPNGPQSVRRRVAVPRWGDVAINYHAPARTKIQKLIDLETPDPAAGKLILWHGAPGTGKTWALRALGREWCDWVDLHYILDPDEFFGHTAAYMISVLLDNGSGDSKPAEIPRAEGETPKEMWRLIVIEDAGELLGQDARMQVGQGLSRLLNVCDGLIGQGLRILVLITTNEEIGQMHEAVRRTGRCLSDIAFEPLDPEEVAEWARARGLPAVGRRTLSDLYAAPDAQVSERHRTGFRPSASSHPIPPPGDQM
jgi:hypothetical protein